MLVGRRLSGLPQPTFQPRVDLRRIDGTSRRTSRNTPGIVKLDEKVDGWEHPWVDQSSPQRRIPEFLTSEVVRSPFSVGFPDPRGTPYTSSSADTGEPPPRGGPWTRSRTSGLESGLRTVPSPKKGPTEGSGTWTNPTGFVRRSPVLYPPTHNPRGGVVCANKEDVDILIQSRIPDRVGVDVVSTPSRL